MNNQSNKFGLALAAGVLGTGLLLGASTAQAATVELDASGNVIRVTNLDLDFDRDELDGFYDVEIVTGRGLDVYGGLDNFDFPLAEDGATAIIQLNNALNLNNPVPSGAGSVGSDQFFVPAISFNFFGGIWGAYGSENLLGLWDACETACFSGVTALDPDDVNTFARFSESTSVIPVPAAVWLFGSGLLGLIGVARRKKTA